MEVVCAAGPLVHTDEEPIAGRVHLHIGEKV